MTETRVAVGHVQVHYNSIYPASDPPRSVGKSKVLGSRRLHRLLHGRPEPV